MATTPLSGGGNYETTPFDGWPSIEGWVSLLDVLINRRLGRFDMSARRAYRPCHTGRDQPTATTLLSACGHYETTHFDGEPSAEESASLLGILINRGLSYFDWWSRLLHLQAPRLSRHSGTAGQSSSMWTFRATLGSRFIAAEAASKRRPSAQVGPGTHRPGFSLHAGTGRQRISAAVLLHRDGLRPLTLFFFDSELLRLVEQAAPPTGLVSLSVVGNSEDGYFGVGVSGKNRLRSWAS